MEEQLAAQLLKAAQIVEEKLDDHLAKLDAEKGTDDPDFEEIRRKRLQELRKVQDRRQVDFRCSTILAFSLFFILG